MTLKGEGFRSLTHKIDQIIAQKGRCVLAIDGGSGSGKSTLANEIAAMYDANIYHTDDFFLQAHQRTAARMAQPGGNLDRERFLAEVGVGLSDGEPFGYRVFDCATMELGERVDIIPKALEIVEGSYSHHPDLRGLYDFTVYIKLDISERLKRLERREGADALDMFVTRWIPLENTYAAAFEIEDKADFVL